MRKVYGPEVAPARRGGSKINILQLLDDLEELVEHRSWRLRNKAYGVDLRAFFAATNRLRAALPDEVKKATQVAKESERIVADAREQANRLIREAQEQAASLVANDEVTKEARRQAEQAVAKAQQDAQELLDTARRQSRDVRAQAEEYARRVFAHLEEYVNRVTTAIQKGKQELESSPSEGGIPGA